MAKVIDEEEYREKTRIFRDREHAGILLAEKLVAYQGDPSTYVIAIPAGGVPVASTISKKLDLPLDLAVTRKLHIPWNPEAGFGAVTWNDFIEINEPLVRQLGLSSTEVEEVIEKEKKVIQQRRNLYNKQEFPKLENKHVILVDDGIASGFSMLTTVQAIKQYKPRKVTITVPTAPLRSIEMLKAHVDEIFSLNIRSGYYFAVASAYQKWYDLTDMEVMEYLHINED
jgi:predicted phosphoribosyltransferase